jgi:hypothetical protein
MDAALQQFVRDRAHGCCEYCQFPLALASTPFQIDHIIARQHRGATFPNNLALICFADNHYKGPHLAGIDPKTGRRAWLFNPRQEKWSKHFRWDGPVLIGRTPVGRATIAVLNINADYRIDQRATLIAEGAFPPKFRT